MDTRTFLAQWRNLLRGTPILKSSVMRTVVTLAAGSILAAAYVTQRVHAQTPQSTLAVATFAGGCFWCMEQPFDDLPGVISTVSGYTGGQQANPTYDQVSGGGTGHTEAVQIRYDPARISYARLLQVFWRNIDPLMANRQFCDGGSQYRSAIFYHDAEQRKLAEQSRAELEKSGRFDRPIVTQIAAAAVYYPAEEYHQDYYLKNPLRYKFYRKSCGRDRRLEELWGETG